MNLMILWVLAAIYLILCIINIAFKMGKSHGYQQARNEDASILLGRPEVKNVEDVNEMAAHLAKTMVSEDALDKKTIYIVRPSDANAVRKLLKEHQGCENRTDKSKN